MEDNSEINPEPETPQEVILEPLEYTPLDFQTQEMRFLVLKPHHGAEHSTIDCNFSYSPLESCEPYTAVVNSRGNPFANVVIKIDGFAKVVPPNIAYFLWHIRTPDRSQRLWFRDVCLDHRLLEERSAYWTPEWMETMSNRANRIIDLSDVMAILWEKGVLPRPFLPRPKDWLNPREANQPRHHPIPIGSWKGPDAPPMPHRYLPLDCVADEIRLVVLWKAEDPSEPLVASFGYTPMHGDTVYHCVSYTWGQEEAIHQILLNGQTFQIRKNLDSFLRATRHPESKVVLWIDAICIDQNNIAERNRQLPRMLEIYEASDVVLCWVGEPDDASSIAIGLLEDLKAPKLRRRGDGHWDVNDEVNFPRRLAALYRFLLRPYFRRIWVIQEVAGGSVLTFQCGKNMVSWHDLDMAAYHLVDILHRDPSMTEQMMRADRSLDNVSDHELSFFRRLSYFRHLRSRGGHSFPFTNDWAKVRDKSPGILDAVILGRDFQSTSPHDKIFALWNLAEDTDGVKFTLDYSKSLSQTYLKFAIAIAEKNICLDVICAAEPVIEEGLTLPSWCPDWSTPSTVSSMTTREHIPNCSISSVSDLSGSIYYAAGQGNLTPRFSFKGQALECAGIILDRIRLLGPYQADLGYNRGMFAEWLNIAIDECQSRAESELSLMSSFWSMLAGDVAGVWTVEEIPQPENKDDEQGTMFSIQPDKEKEKTCRHRMYGTQVDVHRIITRGRRLIVTEDGYMGLAPYYAEKGQKLAILSGCTAPVLLHENDNGTYRFVGSCFVQDWMEGEMLDHYGSTAEEAWETIDKNPRLRFV